MPGAMGWMTAAVFAASVLTFSLFGLALSGHFPREFRAPALQGAAGGTIIVVTVIVSLCAIALAIVAGWRLLPWYLMVIAGGASVLATPLALAAFPDRFVDGRGALIVFSLATLLLAVLLRLAF